MNLEEMAKAVRGALDDEYAGYDPAPGLAQLEKRVEQEAAQLRPRARTSPEKRVEQEAARPRPRARTSSWVTDWSTQAACRTTDPDELFVQGAAQNRAKAVCSGCPVRTECLADALDNRVEFGVWGGMTERERRALLNRRPSVTSWRRLLETARTEYELSTGVVPGDKDGQGNAVAEAM